MTNTNLSKCVCGHTRMQHFPASTGCRFVHECSVGFRPSPQEGAVDSREYAPGVAGEGPWVACQWCQNGCHECSHCTGGRIYLENDPEGYYEALHWTCIPHADVERVVGDCRKFYVQMYENAIRQDLAMIAYDMSSRKIACEQILKKLTSLLSPDQSK